MTDEQRKGIFGSHVEVTALDETIANLESRLEAERDSRLQERFGWVLVAVIVFDVWAFQHMHTWTGPLVIGVFQLLGLTVLANRLGIDEVLPIIDKIMSTISRRAS
ncbi:hypothetical protein PZ895_16250 [Mesorhizobium sp. YIM 152430]|uniref:hypothetical protein n=1 Tax=Mesorhizobium sp. YIM 152430 TaxID=3031761 RepID=UPI0023DB9845|nr:hypothetical protein [Mesorhizobium sp. YIM 152430]MDF1601313.1 hypothetical protein [Mesorhizobium sp. YIM 152430]